MADRPRFFDDLAGVAGGAFSALAGMREEVESTVRARVDEAIRRLDLVKREDLEAVQEMAARARAGQEAAEVRLAAIEAKLAGMAATTDAVASATVPPASPPSSGTQAAPAASPPSATDAGTPFEPPAVA